MGLKDLFSSQTEETVSATTNTTFPILNPNEKQSGETFNHWGIRICGMAQGSNGAFEPYIQNVYNYSYRQQANNVDFQNAEKEKTKSQIKQRENTITQKLNTVSSNNSLVEQKQNEKNSFHAQKIEIEQSGEKRNREEYVKLIIGLVLIIPLTIYLFLFYSSTFYSAFFRDVNTMSTVANAMFDPNAIGNSFSIGGLYQLFFVLTAPVIFMVLGFVLHFFSTQEHWSKYLKMMVILLVTFSFDCILAFKIGEQLHSFGILIGTYPIGETYTIKMALDDLNTWAVIFCGFIVYIIWGLAFSIIMQAYNNLDLNKTLIKDLDRKINECDSNIAQINKASNDLSNEITALQNEITSLQTSLQSNVIVNLEIIKGEMTDFFSGWKLQMQVLECSPNEQSTAQNIFEKTIQSLCQEL